MLLIPALLRRALHVPAGLLRPEALRMLVDRRVVLGLALVTVSFALGVVWVVALGHGAPPP